MPPAGPTRESSGHPNPVSRRADERHYAVPIDDEPRRAKENAEIVWERNFAGGFLGLGLSAI